MSFARPVAGATALVTGANRGIGAAIVRALLARGARRVYAAARDPAGVRTAGATPVALDVTDDDLVRAAAARCADVDLLVNNAGVARFVPLLEASDMRAAHDEMATNYFGTLAMCRAFAPVLARNGGGALVNLLSVASWFSAPMQGSYSASKAAESLLTDGVRIELRAQRTLVTGVFVGYVDTDMTAHLDAAKVAPDAVATAILDGVERGDEDVLVDERARQVYASLREGPVPMRRAMQAAWDARVPPRATPGA